MKKNAHVVIKVDLKLPVNVDGMTNIEIFDAVEAIRKSVHKQVSNLHFMELFEIDTDAFVEDF